MPDSHEPNFSVHPNPSVRFAIVHEDAWLLVVNKPAGVVSTQGKGHERDSLLSGLFARHGKQLQQLGGARGFGLLHRLDRETSGLLLVALDRRTYDDLRAQFDDRTIGKFYQALCRGRPRDERGVIDRPIAERNRGKVGTTLRAVLHAAGAEAITAYRVLASAEAHGALHARDGRDRSDVSLIECRPVTGRLHQIRVHMESIGCPILGDVFYAPRAIASAAPRLMLHAHRLVFRHPMTGATLALRAPVPGDMRAAMKRLGLAMPAPARDRVEDDAPSPNGAQNPDGDAGPG